MFEKLAEKMTLKVTVSTNTIVRIMVVVLSFWLGLQFVVAVSNPLAWVVVAFFFALALNPPVTFLSSRLPGGSRILATAIAYLAVLTFLGGIAFATVPPLVRQTSQLLERAPEFIEDFRRGEGFVGRQVERFNLDSELANLQENLPSRVDDIGGPALSLLQRIGANIIAVLTVLVLTFFMLIEGPRWAKTFLELQPKSAQEHRKALALKMYRVVTGYVNGQVAVAFIGATSALAFMSILRLFDINIPYVISLAAILFVTGLIPLIGNTMGGVIVVSVALFESIPAAIIMAIFFIIYQQIENNTYQPIIQAKYTEVSPLTVLIAAIFGATMGGLFGALLAIPVAGCIRVLLLDYVDRHQLRHPNEEMSQQ